MREESPACDLVESTSGPVGFRSRRTQARNKEPELAALLGISCAPPKDGILRRVNDTKFREVFHRAATNSNLLLWVGFWTLFSVLGIMVKAQDPDLPIFRSIYTDIFNPWATWCPQQQGVVAGCFGTSWNHIGGPYSVLWYWFMIAVGLEGKLSFTQGLFAVNLAFVGLLYSQKKRVLWPYMPTSWLFLVGYPQNMPILFLEALGFWNPLFVILALS